MKFWQQIKYTVNCGGSDVVYIYSREDKKLYRIDERRDDTWNLNDPAHAKWILRNIHSVPESHIKMEEFTGNIQDARAEAKFIEYL